MNKDEAKAIIERWGNEKLIPVRGPGANDIQDCIESSAHHVVLHTQYETRSFGGILMPAAPGTEAVPPPAFSNGSQMDGPRATASIQSIVAAKSFTKGAYQISVPESHRVDTCNKCGGSGHTRCASCGGAGSVTCGFCGGMGSRTVMRTLPQTDGRGRVTMKTDTVRQPCSCQMGRIRCVHCHGKGNIGCTQCAGHGSVHKWDAVTYEYEHSELEVLANTSGLSEELVKQAPGRVIWAKSFLPGARDLLIPAPLLAIVEKLLQQASDTKNPQRHLLFHNLAITQIPIFNISYSAGRGSTSHLWIFGTDKRVYAPAETGIRGFWNRLTR